MRKINAVSVNDEILWSRLGKYFPWWEWSPDSRFRMVEKTNRICRSRTCFICNFNSVKFENEQTLGYWGRNCSRFEASRSFWFCSIISEWIIDLCWEWRKSSFRRPKAKIGNSPSITEKSKYIAFRRSNILFRPHKLIVNWRNLKRNSKISSNNYNFSLYHNNPPLLKDFCYWRGKIERIRTLFIVEVL